VQRTIGRKADNDIGIGCIRRDDVSAEHILFGTPNHVDASPLGELLDDVVGRIDPATDRMVETVEVGLSPRFALSAFGGLWVSNFVEGSVSRIDPLAGKVVATIEVESGPQLMVATPDGVWVSNTDAPAVQRIDRRSNAVVATLEDAGTTPDGLVEFDGAVWVVSDSGPQLHRIDPTDATVEGPWSIADQGTISANQLLIAIDGTFWIPLFDQGEIVQVEPPASAP